MEAQVWDILKLKSMHYMFNLDNVPGGMVVGVNGLPCMFKVENILEMITADMATRFDDL